MLALINEMLDVTRLRAGQGLELERRRVDLVSLARAAAVAQEQATASCHIDVQAPDGEVVGDWDANRLARVLGNLLSNAVKYSPERAMVWVTVTCHDGWAELRVRDRGIGIPTDDLPHVFDWYRRGSNIGSRTSGSGIGLAGARRIVEQHGGTIEVASEEGVGSEFTVHLPFELPREVPRLVREG